MKPFNDSIFDIRYRYSEIFSEPEYQAMTKLKSSGGSGKVYKIAYEVNLLPLLGSYIKLVPGDDEWHTKTEIVNHDVQLMDLM